MLGRNNITDKSEFVIFFSFAPDATATMTGCSGAYQQAVRAVRGTSPEGSVVMLGTAGENPTTQTPSQTPSTHINKL